MATFPRRRGRPPHPEILTPSEGRVLELIRQGKTNSEIALELAISVQGVKYHVSNMLGKLEVSDRGELAEWDGRRPREASGHRRALVPLGLLLSKPVLAVVVATVAVGGSVALLVATQSGPEQQRPEAVVAQPIPVSEFTAQVLVANSLQTQVQLHVRLDSPATLDYLLHIETSQFAVYPNGDRQQDLAGSIFSVGGSSDGNTLTMDVIFDALPTGTTFVEFVLGDYLERVPMTQAEADRQTTAGTRALRIQGGVVARADVFMDTVRLDVTARSPKVLETGLGWRYVIDQVVAASTQLAITYHVEGDTSNLSGATPNRTVAGVNGSARYSRLPETAIVAIPAGGDSVLVEFGAANRLRTAPTTLKFTRDVTGWARATGQMHGAAVSAAVNDGTPIVAWLVSDLMLLPGDVAGLLPVLVDDLGRDYRIEGAGTGTNDQQVRFAGPIDPAATELMLTLQGYVVREDGDWVLEFPVR